MVKPKNKQVTTEVTYSENTEIVITATRRRKWRGKMIIFGMGEGGSFNTLKAIASLSKTSSSLFLDYIAVKLNRKTNEVELNSTLVGLAPDVLSRANTELIKSGLMLKVKNGLYMVNPRAVFVMEDCADAADVAWNNLKLKKLTKEELCPVQC